MHIEPALVGPVSLFLGALVGGSASLLGAIYSQRCQGRVQRVASEIAKRETVYADFVMSASSLLLNAYTRDEVALSGDATQWAVRLTPRRSEVARYLKQLDLHGTRGQLHTIEILEGRGERTTTTLLHDTQQAPPRPIPTEQ